MIEDKILKEETLSDAKDYILKMIAGIHKYSEHLQNGSEVEYINMIPLIVEGLDWIINAMNLTSEVNDKSIKVSELTDKLPMILDAMENEDYILFGDILSYEIVPTLEEWVDLKH
ncbi:hypothetical protein PV797_00305 [Clostridiaceae bacterium M8S5]|nr:hypothetical protein PV797_00305 [Clostridiaceae bacterium M8S5]